MAAASGSEPPPLKTDDPARARGQQPQAGVAPAVERRLYEGEGICAFDFFQSVRLLTLLGLKDRIQVGMDGPPEDEMVRFVAHLSLSFPASAIQELVRTGPRQPPRLTQNFMGLTGPSGVLPRHYTERLLTEIKGDEKSALRDWLDLFNHRLVSLFYRAWEKYRFYLPFERGEATQGDPDAFSRCLYSLIGLGFRSHRDRFRVTCAETSLAHRISVIPTRRASEGSEPALRERELARLDDSGFLRFAGLFAHRPRSAVALEAFLRAYLQLPVKIHQFVGQWLELDRDSQTAVGMCNALLGQDALIGDRMWDVQSKIRICLGPLTYEQFLDFLPDRTPVPERKRIFLLAQVVRFYLGAEMDVEFQLVLQKEQVPMAQTGSQTRLGWNTWSRTRAFPHHAEDAVFTVSEH